VSTPGEQPEQVCVTLHVALPVLFGVLMSSIGCGGVYKQFAAKNKLHSLYSHDRRRA